LVILIGSEVEEACQSAWEKYEKGDCVEALIFLLEDEKNSFSERNLAIWALGQIGDVRALDVLEKNYTGYISEKESWNETLSQYELKKAIESVGGSVNITRFLWSYNFP